MPPLAAVRAVPSRVVSAAEGVLEVAGANEVPVAAEVAVVRVRVRAHLRP